MCVEQYHQRLFLAAPSPLLAPPEVRMAQEVGSVCPRARERAAVLSLEGLCSYQAQKAFWDLFCDGAQHGE